MKDRTILLVFLALFTRSVSAADMNDRIDFACFTELSLFCGNTPRRLEPRLKCLRGHEDIITPHCSDEIGKITGELAKARQTPPAVSTAAATGVAAKIAAPQPMPMPTDMDSHLTRSDGSVYIHLATQPADRFIKADETIPLDKGDMIRTGADGKAEIAINAQSVIELGNNTDFQVNQLEPKKTEWMLLAGSIVAKLHALADGQEMHFDTPSSVAAIRGTELSMTEEGSDSTVAVLDEGRVTVTAAKGGEPVFLRPHQQTRVTVGKPPTPPVPFAANPELSKRIDEARSRAQQIKNEWKPMGEKARSDFRQLLAKRPSIAGEKLPNVRRSDTSTPPPKAGQGASASGGVAAPQKPKDAPSSAANNPGKPRKSRRNPASQRSSSGQKELPRGHQ